MDFRPSPAEEAFRAEVRGWIHQKFGPEGNTGDYPAPYEQTELSWRANRMLAERGWLVSAWPKEHGGTGMSYWGQLVFNEEMAYNRIPADGGTGVKLVGPTLMRFGTPEQLRQHLPAITRAETIWCQGFSEPGAGSDLASLRTAARRDGDDYVVNGQKIWTSHAHMANWMILLARTDPDAPKHKGISYFLVDMKSTGITVRPLPDMAGGHSFNEVFFDSVRVPRANLVGEENAGWYTATATLDFERSSVNRSAMLRRTLRDLMTMFRRDGWRIGERERAVLAEMSVEAEIARLLSYRVVAFQAAGKIPNAEASMAKVFGTELARRFATATGALLNMHGQLTKGSPRAIRDGRITKDLMACIPGTIAAGSSEIQRGIIATRGLGLPR
jgi:alkylation response protein AidB-like acyl-CoA dehydrogenase